MTAPRLAGRWLLVTRVAWVMVVPFALKIIAVSIVGYWMELQRVCHEGARICSEKGFLTRKNVDQVEKLGTSVRLNAAYVIALRVPSLAVWMVVSAIIFWRRSEDRMALLVAFTPVTFGTSVQSFSYGTSMGFTFSFLQGLSSGDSPALGLLFHLLAALGFTTLILFHPRYRGAVQPFAASSTVLHRPALLPQEVRCFPYTCGLW